ncbi:hypothetical protein ERX27_10780 [Macrococcus brunensis]|uniref:XRE family transcriptional regulator n=1 Tax=Macrococcus brunensis TaxID=198483 RepID=A0A4R6BAL9_9STAP|nr:hypothetical protein [Macrococcus brunensis]TDL93345.1 hypothetical protein ERX27_10780 [Macrococcus brunensis]
MSRSIEFDKITAELVDIQLRDKGLKLSDISMILGIREDHVRKINSASSDKRYTLEHLYLLSKKWNTPLESFLPSDQNLSKINRYSKIDDEQKKIILDKIESQLRGDYKHE